MKPRGKGTNAKAKGGEGEGGRAKDGAKEGAEAPKTLAELMRGPSGQQIASLAMLAVAMSLLSATRSDAREISFQEFKTKLLEPGAGGTRGGVE